MITIKRVKIDHYGRSTYGPEVWCRVYIEYQGKLCKIFQLIQTDKILTEEENTLNSIKSTFTRVINLNPINLCHYLTTGHEIS